MDTHSSLYVLSPLDGRYAHLTSPLRDFFSEKALILYRLKLEIRYLKHLSENNIIRHLTTTEHELLNQIIQNTSFAKIKEIEKTTHHDIKAVEYYIREQLSNTSLNDLIPYIHIGLTSEDINNLAYRQMIQDACNSVILPLQTSLLTNLNTLIGQHASLPMLARTHGQAAVPTTLGKELAVFGSRLLVSLKRQQSFSLTGKMNGAVGNYQAHLTGYPHINWPALLNQFIESLGFAPSEITTQINPADDIVCLLQGFEHTNNILLGLCQDMWRYISDDWLIQKGKQHDIGSSTMPHKLNPIEFENAEGNLLLANGLIETIARKIQISRLQRDLSDSTIMRNLGVIFGHCLVAYSSLNRGLLSLDVNPTKMTADLDDNYAILGEALQTYLRSKGQADAYEMVAERFKQQRVSQHDWQHIVQKLAPELLSLTPQTYIGLAPTLALKIHHKIQETVL